MVCTMFFIFIFVLFIFIFIYVLLLFTNIFLEQNAQQTSESNILPTLLALLSNSKYKTDLGVVLPVFGAVGSLGNIPPFFLVFS